MKKLFVFLLLVTSLSSKAGVVVQLGIFPGIKRVDQTFTIWYEDKGYTTAFGAVADKKGKVTLLYVMTSFGTPNMSEGYAKSFSYLPVVRTVDLVVDTVTEGEKVTPLTKKDRKRWEKEFRKIK